MSHQNPAIQTFLHSAGVIKSQNGFVRQFWGHEVEHPELFVWSVDWESFAQYTEFRDSEAQASFLGGLDQVFDFSQPPTTLYLTLTSPTSATTAMRSPVTELAFFRVAAKSDEEREIWNEEAQEGLKVVETVGKGTGVCVGWVIDAIPSSLTADKEKDILYGVFGYASVETHMRWRETDEAKAAGEGVGKTSWPVVEIPGVDGGTGYFHVRFEEGG